MIQKFALTTVLLVTGAVFCYAQKASSSSLVIPFTIDPITPLSETPKSYHSEIITPIDPLSRDEASQATSGIKDPEKQKRALEDARKSKLNQMAQTFLAIGGSFNWSENGGDWLVSLVTSDIKLISVNEKPMNELTLEDDVFKYSYSATLTVKDKAGNVLMEKTLVTPETEQKMTKAALFFNPMFRVKANLSKDNPEKLKKLTAEMLDNKNHLILTELMNQADKALADQFELQSQTIYVSIFSVKGKAYSELNDLSDKIFDTFMKFRAFSKKNRIPREDVQQVLRDAIPVWEKYIAENKELEEKALKGLLLNCAFASTWTGAYDQAWSYLEKVPEAKRSDPDLEDLESSSPPPMGSTVILSFAQSAEHARDLFEIFKEYQSRVKTQ